MNQCKSNWPKTAVDAVVERSNLLLGNCGICLFIIEGLTLLMLVHVNVHCLQSTYFNKCLSSLQWYY